MPPRLWIPKDLKESSKKHLTSRVTRSEALSLYREILRSAKHFHWTNEKGEPWNQLLKTAARKEFQESRNETDPLIIARLLVTGRDCLQQVQNKFNQATQDAWKRIEKDSRR